LNEFAVEIVQTPTSKLVVFEHETKTILTLDSKMIPDDAYNITLNMEISFEIVFYL